MKIILVLISIIIGFFGYQYLGIIGVGITTIFGVISLALHRKTPQATTTPAATTPATTTPAKTIKVDYTDLIRFVIVWVLILGSVFGLIYFGSWAHSQSAPSNKVTVEDFESSKVIVGEVLQPGIYDLGMVKASKEAPLNWEIMTDKPVRIKIGSGPSQLISQSGLYHFTRSGKVQIKIQEETTVSLKYLFY